MTGHGERHHLDDRNDLFERAVALTEINGAIAAMASSMLTCPEALDARARFLDSMDRLATSPGVSTDEVQQVAAGILALGTEGN